MFAFFNKVNVIRAETYVIKKLLEQRLIRIGIDTINSEAAALTAAFEENGTEIEV